MTRIPHVIPYQGSKRKLAPKICQFFPRSVDVLYEPFAGSAALTIFAAQNRLAEEFVIGDVCSPLVELLRLIIEHPRKAASQYESLWKAQGETPTQRYDYFFSIRSKYNSDRDPVMFLFLVARCVANAIRFSANGNFTQSPDKRRMGTAPDTMRASILAVSSLLKGKTRFFVGDFSECVKDATKSDMVYFDPPYRGTTEGSDKRYFKQLETERLLKCLENLNQRRVPFLLSYDGSHGEKQYGSDLPDELGCEKLSLEAGRSTQGTLNGRVIHTTESLYVSRGLSNQRNRKTQGQLSMLFS